MEALHLAFARDREPTEFDLGEVLAQSVPLATTMSEPIDRLRHWSQGRARQATSATAPDPRAGARSMRREPGLPGRERPVSPGHGYGHVKGGPPKKTRRHVARRVFF